MKVWNIDYQSTEDSVTILAIKGHPTEEGANGAAMPDVGIRLQARSSEDIASLGEIPLGALAAYVAKKGQTLTTPEEIWDALNKPKKSKKSSDEDLQSSKEDGTSASSGDDAGEGEEPGKATMKTKKKAAKKKAPKKTAPKKASGARGEKTLKVLAMLQRKSGCTRKEILDATGWPTVSVQSMAKAGKLKLEVEKEKGKPMRYYGKA